MMKSNRYDLIRELAHLTNIDFSEVERILGEIIEEQIKNSPLYKKLEEDIKKLQKK